MREEKIKNGENINKYLNRNKEEHLKYLKEEYGIN